MSPADISGDLFSDLLGLFTDTAPEADKKCERLTREYRKWWAQEEAMSRRGFFERAISEIQKRRLKG